MIQLKNEDYFANPRFLIMDRNVLKSLPSRSIDRLTTSKIKFWIYLKTGSSKELDA